MIELRDAGAHYWSVAGNATTWDRAYFVNDPQLGTFLERMARNPFTAAVAGEEPVELHREHAVDSPVYARTVDGTLRFEDLSDGLLLAAALSKGDAATTSAVRDIRAGVLTGLSVGMRVEADDWGTAADGRTAMRTITSAGLGEVSFVARPANPGAKITSVRHEVRGERLEYRFVPLEVRQAPTPVGDDDEPETCPMCGGPVDAAGIAVRAEGELRRRYSDKERQALARKGHALKDGSFPIADKTDLLNAIKSVGRASDYNRAKNHIITRARALNLLDLLPSSWNVRRSAVARSFDELALEYELLATRAKL